MITYLESERATKPTTIASSPTALNPKAGRVTSNITHGELFLHLKGHGDRRLRLRWEPKGDRERALPAGTYEVTGYRHVATGQDGAEWIWSTTAPVYRELTVKAGQTVHLDVRRKIVIEARAFTKKERQRVALVFRAEQRLGNTLYRNGKRIHIRWQCLDEHDHVLSEGKMRYG